jgi:hypothetical protein
MILPVVDEQFGCVMVPMVGIKQQFVYNSIAPNGKPGSEKNPVKDGVVPHVPLFRTPPLLVSDILKPFTVKVPALNVLK